MNRKDIERSLQEFTGGKAWISKHKLKAWYGKGDAKLNRFVSNIDYRLDGNRYEYFIPDIATAILEERIKKRD